MKSIVEGHMHLAKLVKRDSKLSKFGPAALFDSAVISFLCLKRSFHQHFNLSRNFFTQDSTL